MQGIIRIRDYAEGRTRGCQHQTADGGGGGKVADAPTGVPDAGAGGGGARRLRSFRVPSARSTCR
jgi:hypothetical protein